MSRVIRASVCFAILGWSWAMPAAAQTGFPFTNETLRYTVKWPTGLSLGEAHMSAAHNKGPNGKGDEWDFQLSLDAAVPGFAVSDNYRSTASSDLCSMQFAKDLAHGSRKSGERIDFDAHAGVARRETAGGGKSDVAISSCPHDALTFLYFTRREMGQGRMPQQEDIVFGAPYQMRLQYTGEQQVPLNNKNVVSDRVVITLKGPASENTFEMFLARDAARTPLLIRVPLSLGMFSMELTR
jgi:Protein of unknown function (DUF3108)